MSNEIKCLKFRAQIAFALFAIILIFCRISCAEGLQAGKKYKIIKPVYLSAWYDSLNKKTLSKETARAYLHVTKNADRPYIAFQSEVPTGTVMTIIGPAPKRWYLFFYPDRFFIKLDPDLSQGLDVELELSTSFEGNLDGLNPEIFSRM